MSAPITYLVDGKQYIAFMGGTGGGARGRGRAAAARAHCSRRPTGQPARTSAPQ